MKDTSERFIEIQHELMQMKEKLVKRLGDAKYVQMLHDYERFRRSGDYTMLPRHPSFVLAQVLEQMIKDSGYWNSYLAELKEREKLMS